MRPKAILPRSERATLERVPETSPCFRLAVQSEQADLGVRASGAVTPVRRKRLKGTFCFFLALLRADRWGWSSLSAGKLVDEQGHSLNKKLALAAWPLRRSKDWLEWVNGVETEAELAALRRSLERGAPFGDEEFIGCQVSRSVLG